jgi:hypothetical protein
MESKAFQAMAVAAACFAGMLMARFHFWGWTSGGNVYVTLALQVGIPIFVLAVVTLLLFPGRLWFLVPIPIYWVALTPIATLLVGILLGEPFEGRGKLSDELLTIVTASAMIILYIGMIAILKFMFRNVMNGRRVEYR